MVIEALKELFERDLNRLKIDIDSYNNYDVMWKTTADVKNSAGNLCVHIVGNLNHYIGAGICENGYVRQRDYEFSCEFMGKRELIQKIDDTLKVVHQGFDLLTEQRLKEDFPIQIWRTKTGMTYTLMHIHSHLNYHLGQINYHRRLLDNRF